MTKLNILIKTFVKKKAVNVGNTKMIADNDSLTEIAEFIATLVANFVYNDNKFDITSEDDINRFVSEALHGDSFKIHFEDEDIVKVIKGSK